MKALILSVTLFIAGASSVLGINASPFPVDLQQPDGMNIRLFVRGDEYMNWFEDAQGFSVVRDGAQYVYASLGADGRLAPSAFRVGRVNPATTGLPKRLRPSAAAIRNARIQTLPPALRAAAELGAPEALEAPSGVTPASGTVKNLVILCKFSDHDNTKIRAQSDYDVIFNTIGGSPALAPTGSVRDYYTEVSYGILTLQSTVVAWVTLPHTEAYYAAGISGLGGTYPTNPQGMVKDALDLVDPMVDFGQFDGNNDGYIDAIDIVHSGYAAEWDGNVNRIWSHKWSLFQLPGGQYTTADNNSLGTKVKVYDYHTESALWSTSGTAITRIGVICHETGHFFGMPDLYDTDGTSEGIGSYCLMANSWGFDGGQQHPPHFSAWCKIGLGWVTPTLVSGGTISAPRVATNKSIFRVNTGYPSTEYLLIENRQAFGFESDMPQGGLAIWHIDDAKSGNTTEGYPGQAGWPTNNNHYKIALLQADGLYEMEKGLNRGNAGDVYRGGGVSAITPATTPNTHRYQGGVVAASNTSITAISASANTMTFTLSNTVFPVITSPITATGTQGSAFNYQIMASNGPTSYGASGLPTGLSVNSATGLISGTPSVSGTTNVTLTATNPSGSATATLALTVNSVPPTVVVTPNGTTTSSSPITFTLTFSEPVTGLTAAEVIVTNGTKGALSGSANTYTIPLTPSGQGAVTCMVPAGAAQDLSAENNTASNTASVTFDSVAPTVAIIPNGASTNSSPIMFTLIFSESVTGLTAAEVAVTNGTKGALSGGGTTYMIPVTPLGQGAVTCATAAGVAQDGAGNNNTPSNIASVIFDSVAPTVAITPSGATTTSSPITFTLTFSEVVAGLTAAEVTVNNGTKGALSGGGTTYTIPVTPATEGTVTCAVAPGVAQDAAGNNNTPSNTASVIFTSYTLTVGPNINISKISGDNTEESIAINPANINNLIASETAADVTKFSLDGGFTWGNSNLSPLPASGGDVAVAWDSFGNCFLTRLGPGLSIVVGLSTNGGATFSTLFQTASTNNDQPSISTGPGTPGPGSVWITYANSAGQIVAQGASVTGLGSVGAFGLAQIAPGAGGDFGDIAVGPAGQVLVTYQDNNTSTGPESIRLNLDSDGLLGGVLGAATIPTTTNVGGFSPIPANPDRTIDAEAGLAWDRSGGPRNGRVYLVYVDRPNTASADTDIYVRFSDNNGASWSAPVRANDDPQGNGKSQFMPRIALDQTTGNIAVSFYDCSNSPGNNTVQLWATVSTDGGLTFLPNIQVSTGTSDGTVAALGIFDLGSYTGLTFHNGVFYPCWADNSNSTGDNPDGALANTDIYTARVTVTAGFGLVSAASSKAHGAAGTFEIPLPLSGPSGVECRSGGANGDHTLVFDFNRPVVSGSAAVNAGSVGGVQFNGNRMTVNLTGVSDMQNIIVTLSAVTAGNGSVLSTATVPMGLLRGDVNSSRGVNISDVNQVRSSSSPGTVDATNFRRDVNASGTINISDVNATRAASGNSIP